MAQDMFERTWGHRLSGDESHETEDEQDKNYRQFSPRTGLTGVLGVGELAESLSTVTRQQCLGWQEKYRAQESIASDTDTESVSHVIPSHSLR
jgi:hypothetical protein